jgi:hypothetical protein
MNPQVLSNRQDREQTKKALNHMWPQTKYGTLDNL